jgi:rhodanese-related sulfurtransferase
MRERDATCPDRFAPREPMRYLGRAMPRSLAFAFVFAMDRSLLLRASGLLVGGALAGLAVNAARPVGVPLAGFTPPSTCAAGLAHEAKVLDISAHDASALCGSVGVLFADTRSPDAFAEGHVADALHLPCHGGAQGQRPDERALRKLAEAKTIIVYGASSDDAREVAETLERLGQKSDLRVLAGGFPAWEREGLACASGPCRECTYASGKEPPRP